MSELGHGATERSMKYLSCSCCSFLAAIPIRDDHENLACPFCERVKCRQERHFDVIDAARFAEKAALSETEKQDAAMFKELYHREQQEKLKAQDLANDMAAALRRIFYSENGCWLSGTREDADCTDWIAPLLGKPEAK